MHPEEPHVRNAVERLTAQFGKAPTTAIVLGSGLGAVVDRLEQTEQASYPELGLPSSGVAGHAGRALRGTLGGAPVLLMAGRVHLYEGYTAAEVVRGVRALHRWGIRRLVLTCSAGGIAAELPPGGLMVLEDHINLMGDTPLRGPAWADVRFPDMTLAHHAGMREVLKAAAEERSIPLGEGVYAALLGPAYETPAEVRMMRTLGADALGMSTVPELLAAAQVGLPAAAVAVISNRAAGLGDGEPLTHEEVTETAGKAAGAMADLLEAAVARF